MLNLSKEEKRLKLFVIFSLFSFQVVIIAGIGFFEDYFKFFPLFLVTALILFIVFKNPSLPLFFFIIFLPLQYLFMMILFGVLKVPSLAITIISAWKEIFILIVFISIIFQLLLSKKISFNTTLVDLLMITFLIYGVLHFFIPEEFFGVSSNIKLRLYGFKADFLFIFLYFAGRFVNLDKKHIRLIYLLLIFIGVLTALIGIFEVSFLKEEIFLKLGYVDYTQKHMGMIYTGKFGLAENFWADFGGITVRRAVSVYMSSQPFAQSYLLIIPFALTLLFNKIFKNKLLLSLATLFMFIALFMTITRAVIIVCFIQVALIGIILKKRNIMAILAIFLILCLLFLIFIPKFSSFIERTLSFKDPSAKGHLRMWERSINFFEKYFFFGIGLGMGGETSLRFAGKDAGGESEYFVYASELGIIGVTLYLFIFISILKKGFKTYFKTEDNLLKYFILSVLICGIGILIVSTVSYTRGVIFVYYIFWWLAGYLIKLYSETFSGHETHLQSN